MKTPLINFENVEFFYDGEPVLSHLDLKIEPGETVAIMGPSGCGKSTLLALAAGILCPTSGFIDRAFKRPAMVFQDPLLLPWRTTLSNAAFALKAFSVRPKEREQKAREMLSAVGLSGDDLTKFPMQLSGGMRQRVALARALVTKPDFLLLDEAFGDLDRGLARQLCELVQSIKLRSSMTILMATHNEAEAEFMADRVIHLSMLERS